MDETKMNKQELITAIADRVSFSNNEIEKVIDAFTGVVTDQLIRDEKVTLVGFGGFEVSERSERKGRNPQTGAEILIPAAKVPKFKPGKKLKDAVNEASNA